MSSLTGTAWGRADFTAEPVQVEPTAASNSYGQLREVAHIVTMYFQGLNDMAKVLGALLVKTSQKRGGEANCCALEGKCRLPSAILEYGRSNPLELKPGPCYQASY